MEPDLERCPNCRGVLFKLTRNCPWCGKQLLPDPPPRPSVTLQPAMVPANTMQLEQPPVAVNRKERVYKVVIAVLLLATAASSGLLVNYGLIHLGGAGLPRVSYAVAGMDRSYAWAGYAVNGSIGSVEDVQASVEVPFYTCPTPSATSSAAAAFWVGIDGYGSNTVEQVGVLVDCTPGHTGYFTFWESYPTRAYTHPTAIARQNDILNLEVKFDGTEFIGTINDATQGWTYTDTNHVPNAQRLSAEWIAEAPTADNGFVTPLTDFGKVFFYNCHATMGSRNGPMESFPLVQITMIDNAQRARAEPVLPVAGDGASFSVWWLGPGP